MMRRVSSVVLVLLGVLAAVSNACASERTVTLDPAASEVSFTLHTTFHDVHGTLALTGGGLRFDPATGSASGEVTADATRAQTGNDKRDKKMHQEVLESGRFPRVVFRAERVEGSFAEAGPSELQLVGSMDVHGGAHPMKLPAKVDVEGDRIHVDLGFDIPYVEWGMEDPSVFFLRADKTVHVTVRAEGRISPTRER